jgi:septum formation protein
MDPAPLYLASASPRRRALIQALGRPVIVSVAPVDEAALEAAYAGAPTDLAAYLAREKALAAATALRDHGSRVQPGILIAADTTVLLDGRVLGKPGDAEESWAMLLALRGRMHLVVTGVAVCNVPGHNESVPASQGGSDTLHHVNTVRSLAVATTVLMRDYTDAEIAAYVDSGDPLDKAGAYAVQHAGFHPVARIKGCYTAVVGLPLCATAALVAQVESDDDGASDGRSAATPQREGMCPWSPRCRPPFPRFPTRDSDESSH